MKYNKGECVICLIPCFEEFCKIYIEKGFSFLNPPQSNQDFYNDLKRFHGKTAIICGVYSLHESAKNNFNYYSIYYDIGTDRIYRTIVLESLLKKPEKMTAIDWLEL